MLPVEVFAVIDGGTCSKKKSLGIPWLGIKNSLKVDGVYRLNVALAG